MALGAMPFTAAHVATSRHVVGVLALLALVLLLVRARAR